MGVDTRRPRPPLPAPTEPSTLSLSDVGGAGADDLATDLSRRTDRTTYSIPEDGSPVTIPTTKRGEKSIRGHQSQTSLLIEYFEAGKTGEKAHSRPSVRVRVTPSSQRKSKSGKDHVEISETSRKNRKPSYTRRISLPSPKEREAKPSENSDLSYSEESNLSGRPPVEVEVMQNLSDLSRSEASQGRYVPVASDISSMPPDSILERGSIIDHPERPRSRSLERGSEAVEKDTLKTPTRRRSRSLSRERITQKVMEKLAAGQQTESSEKRKHLIKELEEGSPRQRRPSRSRREEALISGTESSLLTSDVSRRSRDDQSIRSGVSTTSSINNPKLLATVEDAIKRLILPEINALKETQKSHHRDQFDRAPRDSVASASSREDLTRRVSKSSSAPNVSAAKPKVVLNRDGDDPGITLSGDSVKGRKVRRSSRDSTSEKSYDRHGSEETVRDGKKVHKKHSKDKHRVRDAAVAGALGAGLTAAALHHHDSMSSMDKKEKRRRSSKSKSRSASISESVEEEHTRLKEPIPPLPMQSELHSSELTRESILSAETERPQSRSSRGEGTPVREVMRGSPREVLSPAPLTPTRTPMALRRGSQGELSAPGSAKSENEISTKAKNAALAAAGLAVANASGSREEHDDHYSQHEYLQSPVRGLSPIQSQGSYRERGGDVSPMPRSAKSAASMSSAVREVSKKVSNLSIDSRGSSQSAKVARQRRRVRGEDLERGSVDDFNYEPATPRGDEADDFFNHEHEANEAYRAQLENKRLTGYTDDSLRSSNPLEYNRLTTYTDDSLDGQYNDREARAVGAKADYIHTPLAVESAVASLLDPSTLSVRTSQSSPMKPGMERSREYMYEEDPSQDGPHESSDTIKGHQESPVSQRWSAIKDLARKNQEAVSGNASPQPSLPRSARSDEEIEMTANALPWGEPMPEIGHGLDEESEVTTNPSEIQGPGGVDRWPYEPTPPMSRGQSGHGHPGMHAAEIAAVGAAAAAGLAAGSSRMHHDRGSPMQHGRDMQPTVEDNYDEYEHEYERGAATPNERYGKELPPNSPPNWRDEGYISAAQPGYTPEPHVDHSNMFEDSGLPDMAGSVGDEEPFGPAGRGMHTRNLSGNSHGMASPLYDSSTGKGMDRIQSKDVVALMDHLTVRDAQRNARDTEILVTLVRSAAEMRNSFEEMKRFIAEQDKMVMHNTDKNADMTVQKILGGPRPQPLGSPRTPRRSTEDVDDMPARRRNVFKRALKGLSGRSSNDLAKIEDMLMQLLGEVEGLKDAQGLPRQGTAQSALSRDAPMNSYEQLRAGGDAGYEPEGRAGTSSTPNHSGYFSNPSSRQVNGMHSGYDGRKGSPNRISTVLEGDEELSEHNAHVLGHEYENSERLLTPTQEVRRSTSFPQETPPREEIYSSPRSQEKTPKSKTKHKSGNSFSSFIPKISRWSKTTASTQNGNSRGSKNEPYSSASRSGSRLDVDYYDDEHYALQDDDRIRSSTDLHGHQANMGQPRSPSPLIPGMDDPKYQAHRNSLNLEHPQPRPGPTGRHQSQLESQAIGFEDDGAGDSQLGSPDFDQWGSAPSLALNRLPARYSNERNMSPLSEGSYSNHSATEQTRKQRDDGPLVPELRTPKGAGGGGLGAGLSAKPMYSSPLSSGGHLAPLEPIEEVRYSLETDRRTLTPSPQPQSAMYSPGRKITGPRPMGARSPKGKTPERDTTVIRRKPVGAGDRSPALESYRSSLDSFDPDRDTF